MEVMARRSPDSHATLLRQGAATCCLQTLQAAMVAQGGATAVEAACRTLATLLEQPSPVRQSDDGTAETARAAAAVAAVPLAVNVLIAFPMSPLMVEAASRLLSNASTDGGLARTAALNVAAPNVFAAVLAQQRASQAASAAVLNAAANLCARVTDEAGVERDADGAFAAAAALATCGIAAQALEAVAAFPGSSVVSLTAFRLLRNMAVWPGARRSIVATGVIPAACTALQRWTSDADAVAAAAGCLANLCAPASDGPSGAVRDAAIQAMHCGGLETLKNALAAALASADERARTAAAAALARVIVACGSAALLAAAAAAERSAELRQRCSACGASAVLAAVMPHLRGAPAVARDVRLALNWLAGWQ